MSEENNEIMKRFKAYIKKDQPKVTGAHFDWSQFKKVKEMVYDKKSDTYTLKSTI